MVFGNSISAAYRMKLEEGWVQLLANRLRDTVPEWQVINQSISGETTSGGLLRIGWLLSDVRPDVVIVELGGNDGLRGYPIANIRSNLLEIVKQSKKYGAQPILAGMQMPPNYGPTYTNQFRDIYASIAAQEIVALIPFILEDIAIKPELMQEDGIHPNVAGQIQLLENVWTVLVPLMTQESEEAI